MQDGRGDSLAGIPTEEKFRRTRWCAPSATWRDLRRASAASCDLQCSGERKSAEKSPARPGISPVKRLRLESPPTSGSRSQVVLAELGQVDLRAGQVEFIAEGGVEIDADLAGDVAAEDGGPQIFHREHVGSWFL